MPLLHTVHSSNLELFKILLSQPNIDVGLKDSNGRTALDLACAYGDSEMVKSILETIKGKSEILNNKDVDGNTCAMLAMKADFYVQHLGNKTSFVDDSNLECLNLLGRDVKLTFGIFKLLTLV